MEKAERWSFATVLDGLCGIGLVIAVHEIELTENVGEVTRDAGDLEDYDAEFESGAELEMLGQLGLFDFAQAIPEHFTG